MTVLELIQELEKMPPDIEVCYNEIRGAIGLDCVWICTDQERLGPVTQIAVLIQ